ncbi:cytochrome P450 [Polyangium aurulentum]|uniref:cytochrome P450 n=1 Tax=Polyangium aurulentum TaxID=2567896 RepID=UPI0010AE1C34|nr:cytochrome P450 [Polyangium aurulentum]UQA58431.1 cytochrome P450 [Polyangium aurulentum]
MQPPYDVTSQAFFEVPYPTLRRMREEDPVHWHEPLGVWLVTRYADADAVVRDERRFRNDRARDLIRVMMPALPPEEAAAMAAFWSELVWFRDGPGHARLRQFMNRGFGAPAMDSLRPSIAALAREAVRRGRARGRMDVVAELADPVSINAITSLFGIPGSDREQFRSWIFTLFKGAGGGAREGDQARLVKEYTAALLDYMKRLVEERMSRPGDDTISRFLADPARPDAHEVTLQCFQLIVAGYRSTTNQIASTVLLLARNPDQLARLRAEPARIKGAVEESLRCEPSVVVTNRRAAEDVALGGKTIREGQLVFPVLLAANRDPAAFPDPDRFDIGRTGAKHLGFSLGAHYCVGAPLVRLEIEEALRALLEVPRWELLDERVAYGPYNLSDRGPSALRLGLSG